MRTFTIAAVAVMALFFSSNFSFAADGLNPDLKKMDSDFGKELENIRAQQKNTIAPKDDLKSEKQPESQSVPDKSGKPGSFFDGSFFFNGNIALTLDMYAHISTLKNSELANRGILGSTTRGVEQRQGFDLRSAEFFIFVPVDNYFNLYTNIPVTENGIKLEEAYAVTTSIPKGLQIKGGKFRSNISTLDAQHPHERDFFDIALPYRAFLGNDGLGGEKGVQVTWTPLLPIHTQFGVELLQGENDLMFGESARSGPHALSLFIKSSIDTSKNSTLYFGPSILIGNTKNGNIVKGSDFNGSSSLYGIEGIWKWRPDRNEEFILQSEYLFLARSGDLTNIATENRETLRHQQDGLYLQGLYRLDRWRFGARFDMLSLFADSFKQAGVRQDLGSVPWRFTGSVEHNYSRFSRIRLQFSHDRSARNGRENNEGVLQFIFNLGSHASDVL
jgi:hypothetical protein